MQMRCSESYETQVANQQMHCTSMHRWHVIQLSLMQDGARCQANVPIVQELCFAVDILDRIATHHQQRCCRPNRACSRHCHRAQAEELSDIAPSNHAVFKRSALSVRGSHIAALLQTIRSPAAGHLAPCARMHEHRTTVSSAACMLPDQMDNSLQIFNSMQTGDLCWVLEPASSWQSARLRTRRRLCHAPKLAHAPIA